MRHTASSPARKPGAALALALALGLASSFGAVAPLQAAGAHHTVVPADAVQWGPAPPSLPSGAQAAMLLGHPGKEGPFVLRLRLPPGFVIPPHRHTKDEMVTVISGRFGVTAGEKADRDAATPLPAGSFVHLPAGMPHYAWTDVESVVQINGGGPFDVVYLDPRDDPRKP